MAAAVYKRILLKLSGEALMGEKPFGIEESVVARIGNEIKAVHDLGVELSIVIGGGNIIRGLAASHKGIERVTGDYLWQVDIDEFYQPDDMAYVIGRLRKNPALTAISFRQRTFWGGFEHWVDVYRYGMTGDGWSLWRVYFIERVFG